MEGLGLDRATLMCRATPWCHGAGCVLQGPTECSAQSRAAVTTSWTEHSQGSRSRTVESWSSGSTSWHDHLISVRLRADSFLLPVPVSSSVAGDKGDARPVRPAAPLVCGRARQTLHLEHDTKEVPLKGATWHLCPESVARSCIRDRIPHSKSSQMRCLKSSKDDCFHLLTPLSSAVRVRGRPGRGLGPGSVTRLPSPEGLPGGRLLFQGTRSRGCQREASVPPTWAPLRAT